MYISVKPVIISCDDCGSNCIVTDSSLQTSGTQGKISKASGLSRDADGTSVYNCT